MLKSCFPLILLIWESWCTILVFLVKHSFNVLNYVRNKINKWVWRPYFGGGREGFPRARHRLSRKRSFKTSSCSALNHFRHVLVSNNSVTERYKTDQSRFNFGDNNFKFVAHIRQKLRYPECTASDDSSANYCARSWYLLSVVVMEINWAVNVMVMFAVRRLKYKPLCLLEYITNLNAKT